MHAAQFRNRSPLLNETFMSVHPAMILARLSLLQNRQRRRELLWLIFSSLIDVIVKHVPLAREVADRQ